MRPCVIFNPAARGERARRFRRFLESVTGHAELRPTTGPGAARILAREAALAGHPVVIAAGGDGTVFEVLNGLADAPGGLERTALGVLPLGTANVLAHELHIPPDPEQAWAALARGQLRQVDCGLAEYHDERGVPQRAHFVIVAGAGLDARAVQLVDRVLKQRSGKLAYVAAALRALGRFHDRVECQIGGNKFVGRAVLVGNGQRYAGNIPVFGEGAMDSGHLHVRGITRPTPGLALLCLRAYLTGRWPLADHLARETVTRLALSAAAPVPLQLDGEFVGWLPATLRALPGALRVLAP